jgi:hypothetical protein
MTDIDSGDRSTGDDEMDTRVSCLPGSESQVIDLLLEEYRTLREEAISRMGGKLQLLGFVIAGAGLAANAKSTIYAGIAGMLVVVGGVVWNRSKVGIERVADRIAVIEGQVDMLAHKAYELSDPLPLSWETQQRAVRQRTSRIRRWL